MASTGATQLASSIRTHIHQALFGRPGPVYTAACRLDDMHQLSQEFALAAPMGGGALLAVQALRHQPCSRDFACRH